MTDVGDVAAIDVVDADRGAVGGIAASGVDVAASAVVGDVLDSAVVADVAASDEVDVVAASNEVDVVAASASGTESGSDAGCHSKDSSTASAGCQSASLLQHRLHSHTGWNDV